MTQVTIRLKSLDGTWVVCGTDSGAPGIVPESVVLSATQQGPDTASWDLKRDPATSWPDLSALTPVEVDIDGLHVWTGRIADTPSRSGDDSLMSVSAEGCFKESELDAVQRLYVHAALSSWSVWRDYIDSDLARFVSSYTTSSDDGGVSISLSAGTLIDNNKSSALYLDGGYPGAIAKLTGKVCNSAWVSGQLYVVTSDTLPFDFGTAVSLASLTTAVDVTSPASISYTLPTPRRYVALLVDVAAHTAAIEEWVRFPDLKAFGSTAYESGGTSTLHADQVIKSARDLAMPAASSSDEMITTATFSIPELHPDGFNSPRQLMEAVNAYHDWLLGMDVKKRIFFKPRPTAPKYEIGSWSGAELQDQSANSSAEVVNRVIGEGTDSAGRVLHIERTAAAAGVVTLADRRGIWKTAVVPVRSTVTATSLGAIADAYLRGHSTTPFKGSISVSANGVREVTTGKPVHPASLLLYCGELMRIGNIVDPDTGALGRDGVIAGVSYAVDTGVATVELDNRRGNFDALLERLAAVQGA